MEWTKSPSELIDRFHAALPEDPRVQRRPMFGYPAAFAGGHHFGGLFQDAIVVRLGEEDQRALLAIPGASAFEPMPGRRMRGYVVLPESVSDDPAVLRGWLERALAHAAALPAKQSRSRTSKRKTGS